MTCFSWPETAAKLRDQARQGEIETKLSFSSCTWLCLEVSVLDRFDDDLIEVVFTIELEPFPAPLKVLEFIVGFRD